MNLFTKLVCKTRAKWREAVNDHVPGLGVKWICLILEIGPVIKSYFFVISKEKYSAMSGHGIKEKYINCQTFYGPLY